MSDWSEWSKHVLAELKRSDTNIEKLDSKIDEIINRFTALEKDLAIFKAKISLIGAGVASVMVFLIEVGKNLLSK